MLLVACPGGPGSNVVAFVCRADSALSVSLTAISTLASVVTLPLILGWSALYFDGAGLAEFSVLKVSAVMLVITLIPLLLGLAAARFWPVMDPTSSAGLRWAALLFLLLLVVSTFIRVWDRLPELLSASGLPLLILCPLSMLVAYLVTKLFRFKRAVKTTIALEVGLQNSALAIVVATTVLQMPEIALPAALYAPVIIVASLIFMSFGWFGNGLGDESPVQERA
jgi:BASS family bile acid:Na+ symporter